LGKFSSLIHIRFIKIAKENLENNLDYILLENSSNPKTYWEDYEKAYQIK
jgi:hypothetical protein